MDLFKGLNDVQKKAVMTTEGPLLLLAGAGSGKTRVLTHRIAYLIENGIASFNILAITFTNKAAKEMRTRVNNLIGDNNDVWVSTFHSTCVRILRREIEAIDYATNFTIYDADDSERLMKSCLNDLNLNEKLFPVKNVMAKIGSFKDSLKVPQVVLREAESDFRLVKYAEIYSLYQKKLKNANALDFDDIIFKAVELFHYHPEILEKYQNRFKYIMVDEYQDTNTAQYTLIKQLSAKSKNLCVVGDDDQSIYGWRGANIRNILDFEKDFPNAVTIKLEQNYRSTQNILNAANSVIKNNYLRKDKSLWTSNNNGEEIFIYNASNDFDEANFISETINSEIKNGKTYSDFAVLYRTNAQSRIIEDNFVKKGIPYRLFGGVRFYERREIKDILSYLKSINNPRDDLALKRIINVPKRGIGNTTVEKISDYSKEFDLTFDNALKDYHLIGLKSKPKQLDGFIEMMVELRDYAKVLNVSDLLKKVLELTGYLNELQLDSTEEGLGRIENIEELYNKTVEFEENSEDKSLQSFLEEVSLVADIDNYEEGADTVVLMTIHSAKGLEFPVVFLSGMEESIFPSYRSIVSPEKKDLEEERRLCYVGITRAMESLYLTSAKSRMRNGQIVYNSLSRFVKEIPIEFRKTIGETKKLLPPNSIPKKELISPTVKNNYTANIPSPKNVVLDFEVGDDVVHSKYGVGEVKAIKPAGADFEVTISFDGVNSKKFMAHLSKLKKA